MAQMRAEAGIRRLVARYAECADAKDGESYVKLWAPGAVLEGDGYRYYRPEDISAAPTEMTKPFEKLFHMICNHVIHVDGNRATGKVYCMAHHLSRLPEGRYNDHVAHITYHDRYVRGGEGWQFDNRRLEVHFVEDRAVDVPDARLLASQHLARVKPGSG
jgi:hypothetical protein